MLMLPGDTAPGQTELDTELEDAGAGHVLRAIAAALPALAARLAAGLLPGDPAHLVGTNDSGDRQKALDVGAHHHMLDALRAAPVRMVLSEEADAVVMLNPEGAYDVAMDPIDGSGSIGTGAPLGALFALFPADRPADAAGTAFLRPGREAVAACYASIGHSLDFVWSVGAGVHAATWDAAGAVFRIFRRDLTLPARASVLAYNASNQRLWESGLQAWLDEVLAGPSGPLGQQYNMRWLAAAVGDLHRILLQGGVFLYPADSRKGYENGRLRLLYECVPMAWLVEQAGGLASDGRQPVLDRMPDMLHGHCPLIFGSRDEVARILSHLTEPKG